MKHPNLKPQNSDNASDSLVFGDYKLDSRLIIGTGKYKDFQQNKAAAIASATQMVTIALRRVNIGQDANAENILDYIPKEVILLPNTAGCYTAEDAIGTCRVARELLDGHKLVKLEVLANDQTLFPNVVETLKAAEVLVQDGFDVMCYTSDDPVIAKELEQIGCVAVMPLASLIGSGMGILNQWNLKIIIEQSQCPVIVDAGIGTASDACKAMELGCDAVLTNTAIALADNPILMAQAMKSAVISGRLAFLAGRMPFRPEGHASSPLTGVFTRQ